MEKKNNEPGYRKPRKTARKMKKKYIADFMRKNRKEINERNNKLFREAKGKLKDEE